tara:strand:+ start:179 stop:799 length:621 start_codon:yes stop_codon:yes gene_type:complete
MKRDKFKFLKLLSEYRSLSYELKYVKEVLEEGHIEFEIYYRQWCADNGVDLEQLNERNQRRVDMTFIEEKSHKMRQGLALKEFKEDAEETKDLRYLYKALARKLHPDVVGSDDPRKDEYEDAFKRATRANETGKWGEFFDIVDKYNIHLRKYKDAIECLEFDIKRIQVELEKEKSTYSWLLYQTETEEQKEEVVKQFLRHLFGWNG